MSDKAEQLRKEVAEHYRKANESFERCDTDGFLSQWAHSITARKKAVQAQIEDNGGQAEFPALFEGPRRVDARLIHGRYGLVWILSDEEEDRFGRKFIPFDNSHDDPEEITWQRSRSKVQIGLGLHQQLEWAPARAAIGGSGTGLSGAAYVYIKRIDGK